MDNKRNKSDNRPEYFICYPYSLWAKMIQKCKNNNFALAPDGIVTQLLLFSCLKTKCILATRLACAIYAITLFSRPLSCFLMGPWLPLHTHHPLQPPRISSFSLKALSYSGWLFCKCQRYSILASPICKQEPEA